MQQSYLEEHTLELLPSVIDEMTSNLLDSQLQEQKRRAALVLQELLNCGSPKELCLSLENQLGVATDEVAQCFYLEEDDEIAGNQEQDSAKAVEDVPVQKRLEDVHRRLQVVLDTHSQGEPYIDLVMKLM